MNINLLNNLYTFSFSTGSLFNEKILPSLTQQQKKVLLVASVAFACITACYVFYFYCSGSKKIEEANKSISKEKDSNQNLNNAIKLVISEKLVASPKSSNAEPVANENSVESKVPEVVPPLSPKFTIPLDKKELNDDSLNITETLNFNNGKVYEGVVKNGKANGQGKMTYPYPTKLTDIGEFKDNELHGIGTRTFTTGRVYTGAFDHGIFHGKGKMTDLEGVVEEGEYKNGMLYYGKVDFNKTIVCEGFFKFGSLDGSGYITYKDGTVYVGEVTKGDHLWDVPHGQGKRIYTDDIIEEGQFINGRFVK